MAVLLLLCALLPGCAGGQAAGADEETETAQEAPAISFREKEETTADTEDTAEESGEESAAASESGEKKEAGDNGKTGESSSQTAQPEPLYDNKALYEGEDETEVVTMYLTVMSGNDTDVTDHTWTEINTYSTYYYSENDIDRYNVEGILQVGDENGPLEGELGYGETVPNAAIQIKGQTSSTSDQKSFKIRLKEGKGSWRDQHTIALSKYTSDPCRFLNKMNFDLLKEIPQTFSLRNSFVHLYVKDLTEGGSGQFEDYGLFTQSEQMNKDYLESHGLDRNGQFYKVNSFSFNETEMFRLETDELFDQKEFESYLEIKGSHEHQKLIDLIEDVNDSTIPIQTIVEQHFDVENICYYIAFQILIGNYDTCTRNLFYYSPLNSDRWYFLAWDLDASWRRNRYREEDYCEGEAWERGISQFTNNNLFNRMFREEEYRDALTAAVEDLYHNYLTEEHIREKIEAYAAVVKPYVFSEPDKEHAVVNSAEYDDYLSKLPGEVQENYEIYLESLKKPVPVYLGTPERQENGSYAVTWDNSYDYNGEDLTYELILSTDQSFEGDAVLLDQKNIRVPGIVIEDPGPGTYYMRLIIRNESGYEQYCFDYIPVGNGSKLYGCMEFTIDANGTVEVDEGDNL